MTPPAITLEGPNLRRIADVVLADLLPPRLRRLWLSRMGRMAIAQAKKNVRDQKTVDGSAMAPRKDKSNRDKMLTGLVKSRWLKMVLPDENTAKVKFSRNAGVVARKHQLGGKAAGVTRAGVNYPVVFDLSKIPAELKGKHFTMADGKTGCSVNHAAMLYRLDYLPPRIRQTLPGGGAAAVEHIMRNVSRGLALFLIGEGVKKRGKTSVPDGTPARPFLGLDEPQLVEMGDVMMNGIYDRFKAKNHQNLLK